MAEIKECVGRYEEDPVPVDLLYFQTILPTRGSRMRLPLCITLSFVAFACRTLPPPSEPEPLKIPPHASELTCQSKTHDHQLLSVHATVWETSGAATTIDAQIHWKLMTQKGAVYKSGQTHATTAELSNGMTQISVGGYSFELSLNNHPTLKVDQRISGCTTLWTDLVGAENLVSNRKTAATCNAIGTSAQGWYANGKLLKHSKTCGQEVVACGASQDQQGWFVQKKTERILVSEERCAWRKEKPICITKDGSSSWYIGSQLIARDDDCPQKRIECNSTAKTEGWYTFRRSEPQLLVSGSCNPMNNDHRTAKLHLNQKSADQ